MKKSVLVRVSFVARVIVEDTDTREKAIDKARASFMLNVINDLDEATEEIVEDTECPFGTFDSDYLHNADTKKKNDENN